MADISVLSRFIDGRSRNINLSTNALVVGSLKIGASELTEAILAKLITIQGVADVDGSYDSRYFTETELGSTANSLGASLIGVEDSGANFTGTTVEAILAELSGGSTDEKAGVSANDTTPGYLEDKIVASDGANSVNILEISTLNDAGDEDLQIQIDQSKIDHGSIAGLADDDHTQYIKVDGTRAFSGDQSLGSNKLTSLADPTSAQDAATKAYVDSSLEGLKPKEAVRAASSAAGTLASDFENGDSIDGVTLATSDRILIKDQASAPENGIYIVQVSGAPVRASDFDSISPIDEVNGAYVSVQEGTANAGKVFTQQGVVATIDTDDVDFVFFNSNANLVGGDGVQVSGTNIAVDHDGEGLVFSGVQLALELDGVSLSKSASGIAVAALGVTNAMLAGSIADAKLASDYIQTSEVDDASIEFNASSLNVKALGITDGMLAGSISTSKLTDAATVTEAKSFFDATDMSGAEAETLSDGSSADALHRHENSRSIKVAGEAFGADITFAVRFAISGETAGRLYKADKDVSVSDIDQVVGFARSVAGVVAAADIDLFYNGTLALGANDSNFSAGDIGKRVYLNATGGFTVTAPSGADISVKPVGIVEAIDKIMIMILDGYVDAA